MVENKKELVSVRIPAEMNQKLSEYVSQIGTTKNSLILSLLKKELAKQKKPPNKATP